MADVLTLTAQPVRVTTAGLQPLFLALDVSAYDVIDMEVGIILIEGGGGGVTIELWSGAQKERDDDFDDIASSAADPYEKLARFLTPAQ